MPSAPTAPTRQAATAAAPLTPTPGPKRTWNSELNLLKGLGGDVPLAPPSTPALSPGWKPHVSVPSPLNFLTEGLPAFMPVVHAGPAPKRPRISQEARGLVPFVDLTDLKPASLKDGFRPGAVAFSLGDVAFDAGAARPDQDCPKTS